ncbi:prepilin-type N-terminal cleavage/methylation domain-containing protein [Isachenkonia alkalipeptolytica]|uniref:prepilin-type N-terminal cleavage/methylation domain-containing protein n=1 Tax=Isachenkonia alkalipeptolytica TaxID=2565777 RepID=UPI00136FC009|nr:prepilin-type N-terminal cleavage/methylation domain-containing protein [Isachenkonia alkalipeptolytica]
MNLQKEINNPRKNRNRRTPISISSAVIMKSVTLKPGYKRENKGFTLIEILLILGIMMLLFAMVVPNKREINDDLLLYQTTAEIENAIKLARHLSIDESKTYRVDIKDQTLTIRQYLHNTTPVFTLQIPKVIEVEVTTNNVISFNRNGGSSYHRILIKNRKNEQYVIQTAIGSGRIYISR